MFCEKCGNELKNNRCDKCGFEKFVNPIPVSVAIIPVIKNNKLYVLGVKRGIEPKKGEIALIGGFQEVEDIRSALKREVAEEANLFVEIDDNYDQLVLSSEPNPNRTLIFFVCQEIKYDDINFDYKDDNGESLGLFLVSEEDNLAFPLHEEAVKWFYNKHK